MAVTTHLLVLANRTVDAPTLLSALEARALDGPLCVTLLVPAAPVDRPAAEARVQAAVERLRAHGIDAEGRVGSADPLMAVEDEYDNRRYDEVIVSTLTSGASPWLASGLPERVRKLTDAIVHHVAVPVAESAPPAAASPVPTAKTTAVERMFGLLRVDTNRFGRPQA
jgi:hypothetical protein